MAPNPPWADLHQELLSAIATSLSSHPLHYYAFRSVCKSWYSSAPSTSTSPIISPPLPLTIPAPPNSICHRDYPYPYSTTVILSATVIYALHAPSQDPLSTPPVWIAFLDQLIRKKVSFRQPLSLQSFDVPFNFPRNLNFLDFRGCELGRFYNLVDDEELINSIAIDFGIVKVVLLSNMSVAVTVSDNGMLGLLNTQGSQVWEIIHDGQGFQFDDIIEFEGRVLGVSRSGRVYDIGLVNPFPINEIASPIADGGDRPKRLVVSLGKLYLAVRVVHKFDYAQQTVAFKVYQLLVDVEKRTWGRVTDLGGMVFFFGPGFSFSASPQQLGGCCKGNCVVFEDKKFRNHKEDYKTDMVFGELGRDEVCIGVCDLDDVPHIAPIGLYPGYPGFLWPPPSWIWPIDRLKRLENVESEVDRILTMVPRRFKRTIIEANGATYRNVNIREGSVYAFFVQVYKLKMILNLMKEFDKALTRTATDVADVSYTQLLNQVETCYLSAHYNIPCDMLQSVANQIYSKHNGGGGNLRESATAFNGLILGLEQSISKVSSCYFKYVDLDMWKKGLV